MLRSFFLETLCLGEITSQFSIIERYFFLALLLLLDYLLVHELGMLDLLDDLIKDAEPQLLVGVIL